MSGLSRGTCRWPSWVYACMSGTNLEGVLKAQDSLRYCLNCTLTTVFPITRFSVSCRMSRAYARRPPPRARTSYRCFCYDCRTSCRPVDLFTRHQCPCDARHLICQSDRHQPDRAALQDLSCPYSEGAIPLGGSMNHRRGAEDQQLSDLPVARFGDPTKAGLAAGGILSWD